MQEISAVQWNENIFSMLDKDWMLITAGNEQSYNTMTASWGGFGVLWGKKVAHIYIRPQRYTYEFVEKSDFFSLCVFPAQWHKALAFCGAKSGREVDKAQETGLIPVFGKEAVWFEQARLVLVCRKLYAQDVEPACMLEPTILDNYPQKAYHRMYIGEITRILVP